jgi:hypothetical protein
MFCASALRPRSGENFAFCFAFALISTNFSAVFSYDTSIASSSRDKHTDAYSRTYRALAQTRGSQRHKAGCQQSSASPNAAKASGASTASFWTAIRRWLCSTATHRRARGESSATPGAKASALLLAAAAAASGILSTRTNSSQPSGQRQSSTTISCALHSIRQQCLLSARERDSVGRSSGAARAPPTPRVTRRSKESQQPADRTSAGCRASVSSRRKCWS